MTPEYLIYGLLRFIGENPNREGLIKTPARVIKAWREMTVGYNQNPAEILSAKFVSHGYDEMIILRHYSFVSMCEHHLLPFTGTAAVAYVPSDKVAGLSKLGRLVDCFARRLQIQEALTVQIADALNRELKPKGVGVRLVAAHSCMSCRGVGKSAEMVTTALRGVFFTPAVRAEFLGQAD